MGEIHHESVVEHPVEAVWAVLEDVRRLPELSRSTIAVRNAPPRLTAPGQTFRQEVRLLGRRFESTWEVVDLVPGRRLTIEGDVGLGVRYCLTEQVEPDGPGRTRFGLHIRYRLPLGPLGKLAGRLGVEARADAEAREVTAGLAALLDREHRAAG